MDLTEAERDLTAFFAEQLSLAVDQEIFRGQIPAGHDGIAVRIDSVFDADRTEPITCNVQLLAKFPDRDQGLNFIGKMALVVPRWNLQLEHICIKSLFFRGSAGMYLDSDGGIVKTFVSVNLIALLT